MTNELSKKFWWLLYPSIQAHNLQFTKAIIISFGRYQVFTIYIWITCYLFQENNSNRAELLHAVQIKMKGYLFSSQMHQRSVFFTWQPWFKDIEKNPTIQKTDLCTFPFYLPFRKYLLRHSVYSMSDKIQAHKDKYLYFNFLHSWKSYYFPHPK